MAINLENKATTTASAEDRMKQDDDPKRSNYLQELLEKRIKNQQSQHDAGLCSNAKLLEILDRQDEVCQENKAEAEILPTKEQLTKCGQAKEKDCEPKAESSTYLPSQQPQQQSQFLQIPPHHFYSSEEQPSSGLESKNHEPLHSSRSVSSASSIQPSSPFIWRPIMPGYTSEKGNAREMKDLDKDGENEDDVRYGWASRGSIFIPVASEVSFKKAIPAMPKCLALVCSICNCFVPGLGTFLSGISLGCDLSVSRNGPEIPKTHVICVNIRAAFLQLITTPLLLVGWFWSVIWAVAFVIIADEYDVIKSSASSSTVTTTHTTVTTISTVSTTIATNSGSQSQGGFAPSVEPSIIVLNQAPIIIQPPSTPRVIRRRDIDAGVRSSQSNLSLNSRRSIRSRRRARIRPSARALNPILMDPVTLERLVHHGSIVPQADSAYVEVTAAKEAA